jgi:nitric oxide reductase NorD protein
MDLLHLLEPEESVGTLWHRLIGGGAITPRFPNAAVRLEDISARLSIFFRGIGGDAGVEIKSAVPEVSHHRLNRLTRLGKRSERVARARFDGEQFHLPHTLDFFREREHNEQLYYWLAAWTIAGGNEAATHQPDPLRRDLARISHADRTTRRTLELFPGLAKHYDRLRIATLALRPKLALPIVEAEVEQRIRNALGDTSDISPLSRTPADQEHGRAEVSAPRGYCPYLPVPVWGEIDAPCKSGLAENTHDEDPGSSKPPGGDGESRRAERRPSEQVHKGGLFVHRFDKILTWTEFMNLHREVEDDDEDGARKAADDHEVISVGNVRKRTATRLKIDLDLAPSDVDAERLSDVHTYPEWDCRRQANLADHTRVLERCGEIASSGEGWHPGPEAERRIRAVRRQFAALRPRRELVGGQLDGYELDMDALIRAHVDLKASGVGSDRLFMQAREQARDLSVAVLIDVSRSTESFVENRAVIDIEREALIALSEGLHSGGDEAGLFAFSSLRRERVYVSRLKDFDEAPSPVVRSRIAALKPGFYTRLGAAVRHMSALLQQRPNRKRLLLVLTDGKPNDLDHYDGRYGVEDTRHAIEEARRAGHAVFGITIDSKAQSYFPRIFGASAFAILSRPARLTATLPILYRHLIS